MLRLGAYQQVKDIFHVIWYLCTGVFLLSFFFQMRVLETELLRAAAHRDLLRKVALEAEARQNSAEDREAELEKKSEVRGNCIALLLYRDTTVVRDIGVVNVIYTELRDGGKISINCVAPIWYTTICCAH